MSQEFLKSIKNLDTAIQNIAIMYLKDFFSKDYEVHFKEENISIGNVSFFSELCSMYVGYILNFGKISNLLQSVIASDCDNLFYMLAGNYFLCIDCYDKDEDFQICFRENFCDELGVCYILDYRDLVKNNLDIPIKQLLEKCKQDLK